MTVEERERARGRFENKKKKTADREMGHNTKAQKNITGMKVYDWASALY